MNLTLKQKTAFGIGAVGKDMVYALSAFTRRSLPDKYALDLCFAEGTKKKSLKLCRQLIACILKACYT